jgi:hypothetical protein
MNIITRSLSPVSVRGFVDIKVYDKEDLARMEPKINECGSNVVHDDLLGKLNDTMEGSGTSTTAFHINTSSGWFNSNLANANGGNNATVTDRNGQNGIVAHGNQSTGTLNASESGEAPEEINHFFINTVNASGGGTSISTDTVTWVSQATWDLAGTNTISTLTIGRDYDTVTGSDPDVSFAIIYATYDPTNFSLLTDDVLKVSWSIQIGG